MTYADVERIFEAEYQGLREDTGENAPDSYTWFAATRDELAEEVGLGDSTTERILEDDPGMILGPADARPVAWAYECNGHTLARINEGASEDEVIEMFRGFMGYDAES